MTTRAKREPRAVAADTATHDGIRQLRAAADVLRSELDATTQRFREERERHERDWRRQLIEAQGAVSALRAQLDTQREAPRN